MSPFVFTVVLAAALLHATWNGMVKVGADPLTRLALVNATGMLSALALAPFVGLPAPASWPYLFVSFVVHNVYYLVLLQAYRFGDLSQVYPVARGSAPLLVAAFAGPFAGEVLGLWGVAAVGLISAGILSLALAGRRLLAGGWRPVAYALATGFTISVYTVADGLGGRASANVLGYIVWLFIIDGMPLLLFTAAVKGRDFGAALRETWKPGLFGGVIAFASYGMVIWAMSVAQLTYVSALRESSVIFAALIGVRFLGEPFGRVRLAAAVAVAAGAALLQIAGPA